MTTPRERQIKQVANELKYITDNPLEMAESLVELGRANDPNWWARHDRLEDSCYRAANKRKGDADMKPKRVFRVGNEIVVIDETDRLEFARELDRDELLAMVKEAVKQGAQDLSAFKYKS